MEEIRCDTPITRLMLARASFKTARLCIEVDLTLLLVFARMLARTIALEPSLALEVSIFASQVHKTCYVFRH